MATNAKYIIDRNQGYEAVVAIDHESGTAIELQRSLSVSESDTALGMDNYCLSHGGATFYGGVLDWAMKDRHLFITLTEEAAETLHLSVDFKVAISIGDIDEIKPHLARILRS